MVGVKGYTGRTIDSILSERTLEENEVRILSKEEIAEIADTIKPPLSEKERKAKRKEDHYNRFNRT